MQKSRVWLEWIQKNRFSTLIALSIFHLCSVFFLTQPIQGNAFEIAYAQPKGRLSPLTCEQSLRLAQWGKEKSRHAENVSLDSRSFVRKALQAYIEKIDPYRVLFTQNEVNEFQSEAEKPWRSWLKEKKCDYFIDWTERHFAKVRARLNAHFNGFELPKESLQSAKKISLKADEGDEVENPKYTSFADDESALKKRLQEWMGRIYQTATKETLKAYAGDKRRLIRDAIDQLLFEVEPEANSLLAKAALSSMDPYSTYFSPQEFEDFYHELSGGTSGIGIKIRKVPQGLLIEKVVAESPAGKSKLLKPGQIIITVDGKKVAGLPTNESKSLLKGNEGSKVKLEVIPRKGMKSFKLTLTREPFTFEDSKVSHQIIPASKKGVGSVAVITIPSFYGRGGMSQFEEERSSSEDLRKVVGEILRHPKQPRALILDLRGNPGGFLEEAVAVAGTFLGAEPVVEIVESDSKRILRDEQFEPLYKGPLVLLMDEESASAAEVLAGALKDHQRALIVGAERTYGKGSVQKLFHLDNELMRIGLSPLLGKGVVKLTTSIFYSPLGHTPANGGVPSHISLPSIEKSEEKEIRPVLAEIPEEKPFLSETAMAEVKKKEAEWRPNLTALETLSRKRVERLVKHDLLKDETSSSEWELNEAVAIANDLAALQLKVDGGSSVSLRPQSLEKSEPVSPAE